MKIDERNHFFFKSSLFFISMATAAKFVLPIPKQSESVGQTLPQLPWKQKKGGI
jgi:hypothetical protein